VWVVWFGVGGLADTVPDTYTRSGTLPKEKIVQSLPTTSSAAEQTQAGRLWIWMAISGAMMIALGLAAGSALTYTGTLLVLVLGWLAIGGGVVQIVGAFLFRGLSGFVAEIFFGVVSIALGIVLISAPVIVGSLIALIIVLGFLADAALAGIRAVTQRRSGWLMVVLIALLSVLLGVIILLNPTLLLPLLGLMVGANLFVRGVVLLLAALEVRSLSRRT
jgi:uncharacterized membrane protein HdeD (DUF308 family)